MRRSLSQYLTVTGTYWGFTLSDGALRVLVLFHFFKLGYSPFTLALLFLMYEVAGIIANLGGGWLATRFGIPRMLLLGIAMQILGLMFLSCLEPTFGPFLSVIWVVVAQGISGLAKDITKTASKSAIKVVK
ncbi:MAG: MFS transporter, partial [Pseudomonadota bacterium]|nr:MFS transporter [Pseudomonadota bacterium]